MKTISGLTLALVSGFMLNGCAKAKAADAPVIDGAFEYREVYLPETMEENARKFGLNNVEEDWGIWGHNLGQVLPEKPSLSVYAKKDGNSVKEQYCFMSDHLFDYICEYIDRKYDEDETVRFAILPNDNGIVCLCSKCVEEGNTKNNASPAVFNMIARLAERYPNHIFFTSHYYTTKGLPKDTMPSNTGVLISAMDYPFSGGPTSQEQAFLQTLAEWKGKNDRVYIWDYVNNFDDYFTPYPVFSIMQSRLKQYEEYGVKGVFLNGSGADYSTFSDLKSQVLATMTANPDMDWKNYLRELAQSRYPVTGKLIADFMIAQEDFVTSKAQPLPLYDGVAKARQTYLPEKEFKEFHDSLRELRAQTKGDERKDIDKLLGALAMTRLELNRIDGNLVGNRNYIDDLKSASKDIKYYNESSWSIENFLSDYMFMLNHAQEVQGKNKLKGATLQALTGLDPDYRDLSILTDGMLALPSNYHDGNLLNTPAEALQIGVPRVPGMKKLRVWLTYNPPYKYNLPRLVRLLAGGVTVGNKVPDYPADNSGHTYVDFDIPSNRTGSLVVCIFKEPGSHSISVEEIEGF